MFSRRTMRWTEGLDRRALATYNFPYSPSVIAGVMQDSRSQAFTEGPTRVSSNRHSRNYQMKFICMIDGKPRMSWYIALSILILACGVVLLIPFSLLMFVFFPLPTSYRFPVCMAMGAVGVPLTLFVWRCAVLRMLHQAESACENKLNSNPS